MNIRSLLDFDRNYSQINREERNLAALLYYALFHNDNTQRFLRLIGDPSSCEANEFGIYFEYSFLRDLWHNIDYGHDPASRNDVKKQAIIRLLTPANADELRSKSTLEFNKYFGCVPRPSAKSIQSPSRWSIMGNPREGVKGFSQTIDDNDLFEKARKFKWAFNIKPDIVIHKSRGSAVCIEAKLESREGHYPSSASEEEVFVRRGIHRKITQTELQTYMMEQLLGVKTRFVLLVNNPKSRSESHKTITWRQVCSSFDTSGFHPFVLEWIRSYSESRQEGV